MKRDMHNPTDMHTHTARIGLTFESTRKEELLATYRKRNEDNLIHVPDNVELYLFRAEISNTLLDSHFTRMNEKTLKNYVADARSGVAFLRSHNWSELPLGYSLDARMQEEDGRKRVVADFYTVPGLPDADDMIQRMNLGLVRDVSVGFHGGRMTCDLCHQDFWDCRHFPGISYEEEGKKTPQMATYTIDNARLSEVSGVFDGSTPSAMLLKAERSAKAGQLTKEQIDQIQETYRFTLPSSPRYSVPKEEKMDLAKVRGLLQVETDEEVEDALSKLAGRVKSLEAQAADGRHYRERVVADALAEGIRAHGEEFDSEAYESVLKNASLTAIEKMRDDWKRIADKVFPAGRQSAEEPEQKKKAQVNVVPDSAYR